MPWSNRHLNISKTKIKKTTKNKTRIMLKRKQKMTMMRTMTLMNLMILKTVKMRNRTHHTSVTEVTELYLTYNLPF